MSDGVGLALLEARSPRTPSQRILLVALADAGIANDLPEVLVESGDC